eukprot:9500838-Prorocentrum_lima.AAC.1
MTSSLVGSEMCIRDSHHGDLLSLAEVERRCCKVEQSAGGQLEASMVEACLLYTSDAADDM